MSWHAFELEYRMITPLHAGQNMVGNVLRARPYLPGKSLWGAVTARLTRLSGPALPNDYLQMGKLVKEQLRFGYFFPHAAGLTFYPRWSAGGLCYDTLTADHFEYAFLDSWGSTAVDPAQWAAEEGSLHELEFLRTRVREGRLSRATAGSETPHGYPSGDVSLLGHLLVKCGGRVTADDTAVRVDGRDLWKAIDGLQVGGDRTYGYGRLKLATPPAPAGTLFSAELHLGAEPRVVVAKDRPVFAHVKIGGPETGPPLDGLIEPVVGREWREHERHNSGAGEWISEAVVCWAPGAVNNTGREQVFTIGHYGIWQQTSDLGLET